MYAICKQFYFLASAFTADLIILFALCVFNLQVRGWLPVPEHLWSAGEVGG